jgi:hypothetical protein
MNRMYPILLIVAATGSAVIAIFAGYTMMGFVAAAAACAVMVGTTVYTTSIAKPEEKILETGLVQQYLLSNFTIDESTIQYLKKLLKEDYDLNVTKKQLTLAIEKEQTRRELELENEELQDFENKFYIQEKHPKTLEEYISQFVTVFGRGSVRNVYYLKKVLEHTKISYTDEKEFTDQIIALKNLIEKEIERRGGTPAKEVHITINVCPECGNEYPEMLLYCPFCKKETQIIEEPYEVVYCPKCNRPMVRSILKKGNTYVKGYQCRNLKCLYEITYEKAHNAQ